MIERRPKYLESSNMLCILGENTKEKKKRNKYIFIKFHLI